MTEIEARAEAFREGFRRVREEVGKVIVGQAEVVEDVLVALFAGGHVLLEGVPGLGKTMLVRSLARALALSFSRIQFTPDLMPGDIIGTNLVVETEPGRREFRFQPGPIFGQIILADEINRATPKTQSALLEAMQERSVTVAGVRHDLKAPFIVLATENPIEMEGTYPLPEAQLDRFLMKILVAYPSREELAAIVGRTTGASTEEAAQVMDGEGIEEHKRIVREVAVAPPIADYAVRLTLSTHPDGAGAPERVRRFVRYGASPRAAQSLILSAKVRSLLDGRLNASFDDVRRSALPSLRHRIIPSFEGDAEGIATDDLVRDCLEGVPAHADA
ncbi:MAG: AAA family ATPase [Planctomycetes bacterium]|nr:AAA family ATPase [Planctomycetota bacterium]